MPDGRHQAYKKYLISALATVRATISLPISKVTEPGYDVVVLVQSLVHPSGDLQSAETVVSYLASLPNEVSGIENRRS